MSEDADLTAAAYVLGLSRGGERAAVESRLAVDANLRRKVALWGNKFAQIDLAGNPEAPEDGLFEAILASVNELGPGPGALLPDVIPGTLTRRAGTGEWTEIANGVDRQILFDDPILKRRSMLIRLVPGATYIGHHHQGGYEECLVLEGDVAFGDCKLQVGDFHVASPEAVHPAAVSIGGCLLHISAPL